MGKRKPISILKRGEHAAKASAHPGKRQKTQRPQQPKSPATTLSSTPVTQWQPVSLLHKQAAHAVGRLLAADASARNGASLKSLTLAPHIANKRAVYAVTVETLKHVPVLQQLLEATQLLERHPRLPAPAAYVLARDLLWGEGVRPSGPAEQAVLGAAGALRAELQKVLDAAGVEDAAALLPAAAAPRPRTARVNTLKMSVREALAWLRSPPQEHADRWAAAGHGVAVDGVIPELLLFPPGTDLHDHPLVAGGALVLQSKASCMTAAALAPLRGWRVLDACAAPGNKTTQLAAALYGRADEGGRSGRKGGSAMSGANGAKAVIALDKDLARLKRLQLNAELAGAGALVDARCADFICVDPHAPDFADVAALLLDPSCSGSGTAVSRMDHLLPSAANRATGAAAVRYSDERVEALAAFQVAALRHALRFPAVQRIAYSTCSLHGRENEGVVSAVLGEARAAGFDLEAALPAWPRRGVAWGELTEEDARKLVRTDPEEDGTDGFFVALFVRRAERGSGAVAAAGTADGGGVGPGGEEKRKRKKRRKESSGR